MYVGLIAANNVARALARGWGSRVLVCHSGSSGVRPAFGEASDAVVGAGR